MSWNFEMSCVRLAPGLECGHGKKSVGAEETSLFWIRLDHVLHNYHVKNFRVYPQRILIHPQCTRFRRTLPHPSRRYIYRDHLHRHLLTAYLPPMNDAASVPSVRLLKVLTKRRTMRINSIVDPSAVVALAAIPLSTTSLEVPELDVQVVALAAEVGEVDLSKYVRVGCCLQNV
jgi:hypothetical protein